MLHFPRISQRTNCLNISRDHCCLPDQFETSVLLITALWSMAIFTEKGFYFKLLWPNPFPDQLTAFAYFAMPGTAKTHHNNSAQEIHLIPKKQEKGTPGWTGCNHCLVWSPPSKFRKLGSFSSHNRTERKTSWIRFRTGQRKKQIFFVPLGFLRQPEEELQTVGISQTNKNTIDTRVSVGRNRKVSWGGKHCDNNKM